MAQSAPVLPPPISEIIRDSCLNEGTFTFWEKKVIKAVERKDMETLADSCDDWSKKVMNIRINAQGDNMIQYCIRRKE